MSVTSIELQVISRILTSQSESEIDRLCEYDPSYYGIFREQIEYILDHKFKYNTVPDLFTFQARFPDISLVQVNEPMEYLVDEMCRHKRHLILVETFNKIKDLGADDTDSAWKYIEGQCERAASLDTTKPLDLVSNAKERADQILQYNNQRRIPTGFPEIDKAMYGGLSTVEELLVIIARTGSGKAQPLWSHVLTPTGWTTMGELKVGDIVVGKNNDNGRVVKIFPQGVKDYYRVTFSDGTYAECCGDHLWEVLDHSRRRRDSRNYGKHLVLTLDEIRETFDRKYSVDISDPIEFDVPFDREHELDGYLLGVIISDGCTRDRSVTIANENKEVWDRIESVLPKYDCKRSENRIGSVSIIGNNIRHNYVRDKLIEYGLFGKKSIDKFIPKQYLTAPIDVRLALLAGLVDTDGFKDSKPNTSWEFDTASEQLANDFVELARSLGVQVKLFDREDSYYVKDGVRIKANGSRHIQCRSEFNPFYLSSKACRYNKKTEPSGRNMPRRHCKMIKSIEYIGKTECQCILLDNVSHTYITDGYNVTHNTWISVKMMESAQKNGFPVLYYSPEMQASFLGTRFDTWRAHFNNSDLHLGRYDETYMKYVKDLSKETTSAYVLEDKDVSSGIVSVGNIEPLVKRYGIKLLVIDGLSYMQDTHKSYSDYDKYKNICNDLFRLSKKYGCAVVVVMQANRATKDSKDEKGEPFPDIYNIEGSDHPARIATQVFSVRQIFDKHVLDIRMEKSRNANNQRNIFSYSWDTGTGTVQYISDGNDANAQQGGITPVVSFSNVVAHGSQVDDSNMDDDFDADVEF